MKNNGIKNDHPREEIRCAKCHRKLCEANYIYLAIRCPKCKADNFFIKPQST